MKYPFYSPNFHVSDLVRSILNNKSYAKKKIKDYYSKLSDKQYIIITNSCRTALFLAYASLENKGEVITSPLTCKVAIDPIIESGNKPVFCDIDSGSLNVDVNRIEDKMTSESIAIQFIHFGGNVCDMDIIPKLRKANKEVKIIEDCAQSLGASHKGILAGRFGDIACYSLIKNGYGIGGGIFATNSLELYQKASEVYIRMKTTSLKLIIIRTIRNLIETKRNYWLGRLVFKLFIKMKGEHQSYNNIVKQLKRPHTLEIKIAANQVDKYSELHKRRSRIGQKYLYKLKEQKLLAVDLSYWAESSFTKLYIFNDRIESKKTIESLSKYGIEAMHLEHKSNSMYQERFVSSLRELTSLSNYNQIHDKIIALPLVENYSEKEIDFIVKTIKKTT